MFYTRQEVLQNRPPDPPGRLRRRCLLAHAPGPGAGHARVAEAAGVFVPAVFVYFPSRDELVREVPSEVGRFIPEDVLAPAAAGSGTAAARLQAMALAFADPIDSYPDHARVWLDWSTSFGDALWPRDTGLQERLVALASALVDDGEAAGEIDPGLDNDDAARLRVGMAHMLAQMKITGQPREKIARLCAS